MIKPFNGYYKIIKLKHKGDGLNGEWVSSITAVEGNFKAIGGSNEL